MSSCINSFFAWYILPNKLLYTYMNWYLQQLSIFMFFCCFPQSMFFTCSAKGESRSSSAVTPSVCPSVRPKILSSQLLWNYWSDFHETWYVDRTSFGVMHICWKFWSPHFCWSYVPWNLENTYKWPCHCNSSETTDPLSWM